jgi:anthranilate phosphoribosyltransferase
VLNGEDRGPKRDAVLINAAMGLALVDDDWQGALARAKESLDSGAAQRALDKMIEVSNA